MQAYESLAQNLVHVIYVTCVRPIRVVNGSEGDVGFLNVTGIESKKNQIPHRSLLTLHSMAVSII